MLTVAVLILASWVILAAAQNVIYVFIGRLLAGFALGWGMAVQPMYLGEISTVSTDQYQDFQCYAHPLKSSFRFAA